ncbi:MAG TPA: hypothetical protein VHQ65_01425, partial [Thermoanaerobaculia bacterium]|nr:hypothetical protein [Thermoanaerobaculia bacterium]
SGHAEVTTAEAVTSRAVLRQAEGQAPAGSLGFAASSTRVPSPGDLVLPLAPRPCLQRAVAAMPGVPAALAARVEEAAEQLASGFLRWPAAATGADFLWGIDRDGRFEVRDAVGTLLRLEPPLSASSPSAARHLVARLDHLARYRNVEALENHDPRSSLAGRLELGLGRLPAGYQHGDALDDEPLAAGPGVATVQAGEWICLRIHNRSDRRLHVALLDLTTSWAVRQITAGPAIGGAELVDPRGSLAVPLQASVPAGYPEVRDVLKVLAAPRATSFRWLELPPLDGTVHRAHREPPADALERLFAAVSGTAGPGAAWRDVDAPPPRDDWTSARIVVRVMS